MKGDKKDTFVVTLDGALEGAFVIAIEDATEASCEGAPKGVLWDLYKDAQEGAFEVETTGALEVTIELHLKMSTVVFLLGHRSAKNDSVKMWTWGGTLYCT